MTDDIVAKRKIKMPLREAKQRLGDRLVIASLGKLPKDAIYDELRVFFHGAHKVVINS